jgi:hypothetical protein
MAQTASVIPCWRSSDYASQAVLRVLLEENRHTEAGGVGGESWSFGPYFVLSPPSTFFLSRPVITLQNSTGRCVVATSHPSRWH